MYRVEVITDGKKYPLLNGFLSLESPSLKENAGNSPGYLKFKINPLHPHYDKIAPISSELFVYEDGNEIFRGRSVTTEEAFNRTHQLTCESDLAYLCDSVIRPYDFTGSIIEFVTKILSIHNEQVEPRKRFQIGLVNVVDNNNYINRSNTAHSNTLDCLRDKLVKTHGGYLRTRLENGIRYLDYVTDGGGVNDQSIRYGENLLSYNKTQDATTLFTALIPIGADVEVTNPDGTVEVQKVDIKSVNNGLDYIYDADAVARYGWIFRTQRWEDVTLPENLLKKAREYLKQSLYLGDVLKLTAVDLANVDVDIGRLKTGYWTRVISKPHGINVMYILEERTRYLQNPGKDSISLGGTVPTLSGTTAHQQAEISAYVQQIANSTNAEIIKRVSNATQLITGGLGGYIVIGMSDAGHPEEILIMDAPVKENARNVIRLNKNGLGFSTAGYNGPYNNAWTIDGHLLADFITAGTMFAERIKGGVLTMGGVGNGNGIIRILDASGNQIGTWNNDGLTLKAGEKYIRFNPAASNAVEIVGNPTYWDTEEVTTPMVAIKDDLATIYEDASQGENGLYTELSPYGIAVFENGDEVAHYGYDVFTVGVASIEGDLFVEGDLYVNGEKDRVVEVIGYGELKLAAFETPTPMFGDIGSGRIAEDGLCYVQIDPVFSHVINAGCEYQVNIQEYGAGSAYVSERKPAYFIVRGTPGLQFGWEMKARQKGYEQNRMDRYVPRKREKEPTYAEDGAAYYRKFMEGMKS